MRIEALLHKVSIDLKAKDEAKVSGSKARTFSQAGLGGEEKSDPKTIRTTSPPKLS